MTDTHAYSEFDPIQDAEIQEKVFEAALALNADRFSQLSEGDDVSELSSNTVFEGIEISSDGIFKDSARTFVASATVYLTLNYGASRDSVSMPDSYPAIVRCSLEGDAVEITAIEVDTGSFYE